MPSPLMTDEEVEMADKQTVMTPKKSLEEQMKESLENEDSIIKEDLVEETEEELKKDIPSSFIEINLVSNGRIEGIPSKLHFRCYSASDALDLNVDDDNKVKAITKVLTRLNYEGFDVSQLPTQDVLFILYKLHGAFISKKITRKVYIDDTLWDFGKYCLSSGGEVLGGPPDWDFEVKTGPWSITYWPDGFPEDMKYAVLEEVNSEIPWGCCGGCI